MGFLTNLITAGVSLIPGIGPIAAAGLAAGGQLLGGALEMRAQNKERAYAIANRGIDFVKLRDDAIKAGFNPLTALNATGGQGYDRVAGLPSLGSAAFMGDAVSSFGKALFDLRLQESDQLARSQLAYGLQGQRVSVDHGAATGVQPASLGSYANPIPQYVWIKDDVTGQVFKYLNPDLTDTSAVEIISSASSLATAQAAGALYDMGTPAGGAFAWPSGNDTMTPKQKAAWGWGWQMPSLPSMTPFNPSVPDFELSGP